MRLICPNCGAQYEVAEDVIPEGGRDVQCSNCGHTWFETPGASVAAENDPDHTQPEDIEDLGGDDPDDLHADDLEDEVTASPPPPSNYPPLDQGAERMAAAPIPPGVERARPQRQKLDPSITDILREEAAREEAAREAERTTGLESQGDLGLDQGPDPAKVEQQRQALDRMARLKGPSAEIEAAVAATVASSRRELLPDIDEINSTLRPESERSDGPLPPGEVEERERHGFRLGFIGALALICLATLIYLFANPIAAAVPPLSGVLESYSDGVDNFRIWVDVKIQGWLTALETPESG